jgi:uncharacterized protein
VQSTLTRAVIFSAMATATAFGSLWLSSDPGISSMGELMALALVCTMSAAVLFQPALMGRPRERAVWVVRREVPIGARSEARPRAESRRFRAEHALAGARDHDQREKRPAKAR